MSEEARKLRDDAIARLDEADTLAFRIMHTGGALEGERVLGAGVACRSTRRALLMRVFAMEAEADFHAARKAWSEETLQSFRDTYLFELTVLFFSGETGERWTARAEQPTCFGEESQGWISRDPEKVIDGLAALRDVTCARQADGTVVIGGTSAVRRSLFQRTLLRPRRSHSETEIAAHLAPDGTLARVTRTSRPLKPFPATREHLVIDQVGIDVALPPELDEAVARRLIEVGDVGDAGRGDWTAIQKALLGLLPAIPTRHALESRQA